MPGTQKGVAEATPPLDEAMDSSAYSAEVSGAEAAGGSSWTFFFLAAFSGLMVIVA
jgi:hypothetical protein